MKTVQCKYQGIMDGGNIILWNLLEDIPGHPAGSTVSTMTLTKKGFMAPQEEVDRAFKLIVEDPSVNEDLKQQILDFADFEDELLVIPIHIAEPVPHFPVEISKPVGMSGTTHLHLQIWIRHWFKEIKGRDPEEDFVNWACDVLERRGAILIKHEPQTQ